MKPLVVLYTLESYADDRRWSEDSCGATGPGLTQFATEAEAENARDSLIACNGGWTSVNTRVRDTRLPYYQREAPPFDAD